MLDKLGSELTINDKVLYIFTMGKSYYMKVCTVVNFTPKKVLLNPRKQEEVLNRFNKNIYVNPENLLIVNNDPRFIQGNFI